jgi:RimJ/RimL family protein N-acetyltransferase
MSRSLNAIQLETSRLLLHPLSLANLQDILAGRAPQGCPPIDPQALDEPSCMAMQRKVARMEQLDVDEHVWQTYFLITLKTTGVGIGFIGFKGPPDAEGLVEVGYGLAETQRRQGYMSEALAGLVAWAANDPRCKGITAMHVLKTNIGSQKVLAHCGFEASGETPLSLHYIRRFK